MVGSLTRIREEVIDVSHGTLGVRTFSSGKKSWRLFLLEVYKSLYRTSTPASPPPAELISSNKTVLQNLYERIKPRQSRRASVVRCT